MGWCTSATIQEPVSERYTELTSTTLKSIFCAPREVEILRYLREKSENYSSLCKLCYR